MVADLPARGRGLLLHPGGHVTGEPMSLEDFKQAVSDYDTGVGSARVTLVEFRESAEERLAVCEILAHLTYEFEYDYTPPGESNPSTTTWSVTHEMTGEVVWNPERGHLHSIDLRDQQDSVGIQRFRVEGHAYEVRQVFEATVTFQVAVSPGS